MNKELPSDFQLTALEDWVVDYPFVFESQVEALRQMLPEIEPKNGIEINLGTGLYAEALGIKKGIEASQQLRAFALRRGITVENGKAERLPFPDGHFDFVLMVYRISYFNDLHIAFGEAYRVLNKRGVLVIGFTDRNSIVGQGDEPYQKQCNFYRHANFFAVEKVVFELIRAGFIQFNFCQTLFQPLDQIKAFEAAKRGYGQGAFVVIQAGKT